MSDIQARLKDLSPAKRALLEKLLLERSAANRCETRIPKRPIDAPNALSHAEQRLWFVDRLERDHPFYNMPLAARVHGHLDAAILQRAVSGLVRRHESLRTTYQLSEGVPERFVHEKMSVTIQWHEVSGADAKVNVDAAMRQISREPFDIERGPLLKVVVFRVSEDEHIVLLLMHHIISDGWSMIVMLKELTQLYDAMACGSTCPLAPLAIQYSDFAHWQNARMTPDRVEDQLRYWREKLLGAAPVLDIPTDFPRPAVQDFDGATVCIELSASLTAKVNSMAREWNTTPFVVLLAAQALLLGRYSRQDDLVLGTASAGRVHPEIESQIGFFVNTLALRIQLESDFDFSQLVQKAHETVEQAHEHAEVPFERLVDEFTVGRDRSFSPIFQAALVMQNLPREFSGAGGAKVEPILVDNGTAKYDLTFFLWQEGERLVGHAEYRTSLFRESTVNRLVDCFKVLLGAATTSPQAKICNLPILSDSEYETVTQTFNQTAVKFNDQLLLHELVEQQADERPEAIAIIHGNEELSFLQLDQQANSIANALLESDIRVGDAVVVLLPRSAELIAVVLGILKVGGTFAMVDPATPTARLEYIIQSVNAKAVIDSDSVGQLQSQNATKPDVKVLPTDRAYVIFTSGSTGEPKGVEVEHHSIVNFILAQIERMGLEQGDRASFSFSPSFDGALSEIFYSLSCGATCVVVDAETMLDPQLLTNYLRSKEVSVCKFPPALLSMLDESQLPSVRILASAGDKLTGELASRWTTSGRRFFNGYGPTEVSVGCTMMLLDGDCIARPPIGTPMANMRIYVLDQDQRPVPIGAIGEIYIGGAGVARGYLNQPEMTNEKFLPDPFAAKSNARMYRTGDLGRWQESGVLEFAGRADDQVSLRGYRVEPGEIAMALERLPQVRQATVIQREENGSNQLVAYVVAEKEETEQLQSPLETKHVDGWRELFQQSHRSAPAIVDPSFNIHGWVSTFTNKPIPSAEMQDWTDKTVRRIRDLNPEHVLEIGCGTGLLLLRLAEDCASYTGSDLLSSSLENVRFALKSRPDIAERVELYQALADDFDHVSGRKFDTIILNSVVQYFPSADYFLRVLRRAAEHLTPDGTIFLGDVRNLRLHKALATAVELFQSEPDVPIEKLRQQIALRLEHEEELLLDPASFQDIHIHCPGMALDRILLKDAEHANELSCFRYDVLLRPKDAVCSRSVDVIEYSAEKHSAADLQRYLETQKPNHLRVTGVPNQRVQSNCDTVAELDSNSCLRTAQDLMNAVPNSSKCSADPNEFFALGDQLSYRVDVSWNLNRDDQFDVCFTHENVQPSTASFKVAPKATTSFRANQPLSHRRSREITATIHAQLSEELPSYMLPSAIVIIDEFPKTLNGKIDRAKLPAPVGRPAWAGEFVAPTSETEQAISRIWESLLDIHPIGLRDDFFQLGGHSMLAVRMIAEVDEACNRQLPLAALFQNPTIAHLAELVDRPDSQNASCLVRLKQSANGDKAPLFCVHPAGGTVFCYLELAKNLPNDRPVFGLQAVGIDGSDTPHDRLEDMAIHYARTIAAERPNGPIHISGWSLGGNIAFEVARQLQQEGRDVASVSLLDSGLLSPETELREEDFLPLLMALFPGAVNVSLDELRDQDPQEQIEFFAQRARVAGIVPTEDIDQAGNIFRVFQANVKAVHQYRAEDFRGVVHLFRPADQSKTNNLFDDPVLGWSEVAKTVDVVEVPGDHAHMLQSPAVEVLAARLESVLNQSG